MNDTNPILQAVAEAKAQEAAAKFKFIATVLCIYLKEDQQKQRHINVLIDSGNSNITKADLQALNVAALSRLQAENNVPATDVKDLVILSINLLGFMTDAEFDGQPQG